jgi:putative endonuclease
MNSAATKDILGRYGEDLAVCHLQRAGMRILDRNWRCSDGDVRGEIDVVGRSADALVFCEVKTRRSVRFGTPAEAVSVVKQARIRRLARRWLAEHEPPSHGWSAIRFDVVAVLCPWQGDVYIEHLPDAF